MLHHNVDCKCHGPGCPFQARESLHCYFKDTPYEGMRFTNWPRYTILRGKVMWANGKITGKVRDGEYVKRGPSQLGPVSPRADRDARSVADWLYE